MRVVKSRRKPGIYYHRFVVRGLDERGRETSFLINSSQAKSYSQAVRFWNRVWGSTGCVAFYLCNDEPISDAFCHAA